MVRGPLIRKWFSNEWVPTELRSHIPRVQTSGNSCVRGAFDDGAAVGEQCHFIRLVPELQHELGVLDLPVRSEATGDFREVDGALALVDLHRVAAAQGNMRAAFSGEVDEVVLLAGAAVCARSRGRNLCVLVGPYIVRPQRLADVVA